MIHIVHWAKAPAYPLYAPHPAYHPKNQSPYPVKTAIDIPSLITLSTTNKKGNPHGPGI
jgi:hypothetical protein